MFLCWCLLIIEEMRADQSTVTSAAVTTSTPANIAVAGSAEGPISVAVLSFVSIVDIRHREISVTKRKTRLPSYRLTSREHSDMIVERENNKKSRQHYLMVLNQLSYQHHHGSQLLRVISYVMSWPIACASVSRHQYVRPHSQHRCFTRLTLAVIPFDKKSQQKEVSSTGAATSAVQTHDHNMKSVCML